MGEKIVFVCEGSFTHVTWDDINSIYPSVNEHAWKSLPFSNKLSLAINFASCVVDVAGGYLDDSVECDVIYFKRSIHIYYSL